MAEPITLVVSIDTEEDNWHPARSGITVENIRELPRLHEALQRLGVRPSYFATYQVAREPWAAGILRDIRASGNGEIGAHLHPWNTPPIQEAPLPRNTMLWNLPQELQMAKIETLTQTLTEAIGERPRSFRAGRWGFGQSTAAALLACGYQIDSSITPFQSWARYDDGPCHVGAPLDVYRMDGQSDPRFPVLDGALAEVPVSAGYSRGSMRHWSRIHAMFARPGARRLRLAGIAAELGVVRHITLSPEIESLESMLVLSRKLIAHGVRYLHATWHSPTLQPGLTPFAATRSEAERLYATFGNYVEQLSKLAPLRCATVAEAATGYMETPAPPKPTREQRLVVISYHHPPDGAIGGMRWAGLTKYLAPLGWKSWVITAAPQGPPPAGAITEVISCPRRSTLNDWYRTLRNGTPDNVPGAAGAQISVENGKGSLLARLRLEAAMMLTLPDEGRGWVFRSAWRARKLIRRLAPDVVISSGPPHSAHLVAWLATRGTRTRWFADFRDPWAGPIPEGWRLGAYESSRLTRGFTKKCERIVVSAASALLCNTREFAEAMKARYPDATVEWLSNGTDADLLPKAAQPLQGAGIVYVGTLYGGRDLTPVLRGLRVLLDRHPGLQSEGPALRIAGALDSFGATDTLARQIDALRLGGQVALLGVLDRRLALELSSRGRLALVLAQGQNLQVPAKLYELVAMGVPTLVLAPHNSATSAEARRIGALVVDPGDEEGMVTVLEETCLGPAGSPSEPSAPIDYRSLAVRLNELLVANGSNVPDPGKRVS